MAGEASERGERRFPLYWRAEGLRPLESLVWQLQLALPFGGYPLHRREPLRPFFIIGAARSGTTLLRRILTAHDELHVPPETYVLGEAIKWFHRLRRARWDALVHLVLARLDYHPRFRFWDLELRPLAAELCALPPRQRSLACILDRLYRFHAEQAGKPQATWGDKTPLNTYQLEKIDRVFPAARYVHVVRDGLDCVDSYLRHGFLPDVEAAAWRWASAIDAAGRFSRHRAERCLEIRYEELASEPEPVVRRVVDFLGVEYQAALIASEGLAASMGDVAGQPQHARVGEPVSASAIGCGRAHLSLEDQRAVERLIGDRLQALGYGRPGRAP